MLSLHTGQLLLHIISQRLIKNEDENVTVDMEFKKLSVL